MSKKMSASCFCETIVQSAKPIFVSKFRSPLKIENIYGAQWKELSLLIYGKKVLLSGSYALVSSNVVRHFYSLFVEIN